MKTPCDKCKRKRELCELFCDDFREWVIEKFNKYQLRELRKGE